jgi:DNA-binding MarR family transcriptional regulator
LVSKGIPDLRQPPISQKAIATIIRAADAIQHSFDAALKVHGLTSTQYRVLWILRGSGSRGASCSGIGDRLIKAMPDVTRLLDRLERRGWVRRERDVKDRRTVKTWITIEGLKLLGSLDGQVRELNLRPFKLMSTQEIKGLVASLEKLQQNLKS